MGIIRAFFSAVGGGLADSWQEVIEAGNMGEGTVFCRGVTVRKNDRRGNGDLPRQGVPAKTDTEPRDNKSGQKHQTAEFYHHILLFAFFFGVQTRFQKLGAFEQHDKTCKKHGNKKDSHKKPSVEIF